MALGNNGVLKRQNYSFRVVTCQSVYNLDYSESTMTQAQLDILYAHYNIPVAITMRALAPSELLSNTVEDGDEIPFLVITLKCGVRLPLVSFVRQLLSELPLHPFQASPAF